MNRRYFKTTAWLLVAFLGAQVAPRDASADILFESGTLGPTGIPQGSVAATNITPFVFTGVRFELTRPVITSQVGGHFVDRANGTFFGAIVQLDDENDFPDSGNLATSDVLGAAILMFPVPSAEVFGDLTLSLDPGWYALVFGSGLFGTNGDGAAPRNNPDIGEPAYIAFQTGTGWFNLSDLSDVVKFVDHRFAVIGSVVPEPAGLMMAVASSLSLLLCRNARQNLR
jgi:hypothetical protein